MQNYSMIIGGKKVLSESKEFFEVLNPANEQVIAHAPLGSKEDTKHAIEVARTTFDSGIWGQKTPGERSLLLWKIADLLEKQTKSFAHVESLNQGKTIKQAQDSDLPFCVDNIRYFATACRHLEGKAAAEYMSTGTSMIRREPIGVVGSITPWNYPLLMAVWKIMPAIAAGNSVVIKPASFTPLTTIKFVELIEKAGVPRGVVNVVTGPGNVVGETLATSKKVDMVSLTGDCETGKSLMEKASHTLKKVHLELGGKAPFIVFADADVDAAVEGAIVGGYVNAGQDCTAATRLYVQEKVYNIFIKKLVSRARTIKLGNQLQRETDMGPLVSFAQRNKVETMVNIGKEEGAKLVLGGKKLFDKGFYFAPTIFTDCTQEMEIVKKEIFGPVLTVLPFTTQEEVIAKANDVQYGLASSVWTKNIVKAMKVANALQFGEVWINDHLPLASEMPHGGFKQSGFGKDLSMYAFEEYTQIKHVYVDLTEQKRKSWHYTVYGKP